MCQIPAVPLVFVWLMLPLGTRPAPVEQACCLAPHPLDQLDGCPA